ncbi:MAG: PAS domain S-box protein [Ramlibacter sp.]
MRPGPSLAAGARAALRGYGAAVLLSIAFLALRELLEPVLAGHAPFLVLSAAPLLAAWYAGAGPGLLALALCTWGGQALFAHGLPQDAEAWLRLVSFVVLGGLSVWLLAWRRVTLFRLRAEHARLLEAQQALHTRERRVSQTFEASPSGMLLVDAQGAVRLVNREAERLFGYPRDELVGMPFDRLVPDAHRVGHAHLERRSAPADDGPPGFRAELQARRKDGAAFPVRLGLNPLPDGDEGLTLASVLDLSGQRAAEAALDASEARLQQLFETNLLGIMFWSIDRRVLDANDELLRIWGRTRDELRTPGLWLDQLTPPEYAGLDQEVLARLRDGERVPAVEKQYLRPDGSRVWVLVGTAPTRSDQGVAFVLDISGRKEAELALRSSEQHAHELAAQAEAERAVLDATLDAVPAGIVLADPGGRMVRFNPANEKLWGKVPPTDGVDGYRVWKGWWAGKSPRRGEPLQVNDWAMARALRGEMVHDDIIEIEPFGEPGVRKTVVNSAAPVRDAHGRIIGAVVAQTDVSALVKAEAAMRENAAMFQSLADNIAQLAWMTDATGFITWYNRRWFEYTGTTEEQMKGRGWQWVHHPDHVARVMAKFRRHINSGEPWEDTFPLRGRDGEYRWFLSRAFPLRDHAGRIVSWFGTNTDVDAQRQAEEALREADRRKDEFIAVLAHELRNPLAPVRNAVEILKRIGVPEPRLERVRDIIDRQVTHMARLIDDLLDVSRIARGKLTLRKEPCDVTAIVCQTAEDYRASLEAAGQRLVLHGCDAPAWVQGDPVRIAQMVGNLLTNAARFNTGAGTVDVHSVVDPGKGTVRVIVTDTGIGMDEDLLGRLFDPFAQATQDIARSKGGLGLGLALTRGLAELHGGGVMADSEGPGHGSRFTITLPLLASEHAPRPAAGAGGERQPLRVLVIEDNHDTAATLGELLQLGGHEVELAYDGRSGIELARRMRPDAVISDLGLPGAMSGYDVARALRGEPALDGLYLIALSGYADASARRRSVDAGFDAHLAKPPDIAALEQALAAASGRATASAAP